MNRFITRWDEPFAGKEKLGVNICWHGIHSDIHDRAGRSQKLLPVLSTRSYFTLACWQARTTDVFRFFTAVRKIIPGITCKRSITTITRNPYRSPKFSDGSCYSVDNAGKKKFDIVQNIITLIVSIFEFLILPEGGHFTTDECFEKTSRPVYQKWGPSPRFTWNNQNTSRMSRGFFEDLKIFFTRDIFQIDSSIEITRKIDTYIKR